MLSRILDCFDEPRGFSPSMKTKKPPVWVVFCFGGEGGILCVGMILTADAVPKIIILPRDSGSPLCFAFRLLRRTARVLTLHENKKPPVWVVFCFGGEGGIRTLEPLLMVTRFPIVRARPTTRLLQTCASVFKALDYYNSYCHKNQVFF